MSLNFWGQIIWVAITDWIVLFVVFLQVGFSIDFQELNFEDQSGTT